MASGTHSYNASRGAVEWIALGVLAVVGAAVWLWIYDYSQTRFFTVDEYQYGHATWLVAQGHVPYVDFYEHHFPMSYVLHSPGFADEPEGAGPAFSERALRLRKIAFGYALAASIALAVAAFTATRSAPVALLTTYFPAVFGFGLMSAVDYRADNAATFSWLVWLALLEANRSWRRRGVAALCGAGMAVTLLMTQKMLFLIGATMALTFAVDFWRVRREGRSADVFWHFPSTIVAAGSIAGIGLLGIAGAFGMWVPGWEYTIAFGVEHEALYHTVPFTDYTAPFLADTAFTTVPLLAVAGWSLFAKTNRFWLIPVGVAFVGALWVRAQFPYNHVLHCYLLMACALRGFAIGLKVWAARMPRASKAASMVSLLWWLPLVAVPDQIGFAANTSSNRDQLHVLDKIERHTQPGDRVIDSAGGALFRDHASWYWYHGSAHRKLWAEKFEREVVDDYRESQALFWIRDFRYDELPKTLRRYLVSHYVWAGGELMALGFLAPPSGAEPSELEIDVIRPGEYSIHPLDSSSERPSVESDRSNDRGGLAIDGKRVDGNRLMLEIGRHTVTIDPNSPGYILSPLPATVFQNLKKYDVHHTPLFQYRRAGERG